MTSSNSQLSLKQSRTVTDLSYAELYFVIKKHNLTISKSSPLYFLLGTELPDTEPELPGVDLLNPVSDWHDALIAVCEPDFQENSFLIYPGGVASSSYFINRASSKTIVGCKIGDNNQISISFPWEPREIMAESFTALKLDSISKSGIKMLEMSPDGFLAFSAATDAIKEVLLFSVLNRQYVTDFRMKEGQLDSLLERSHNDKNTDLRWLTTLFRLFSPKPYFPEKHSVSSKGFKELVALQLIVSEDDGYWSPSLELMDIAANWTTPLPAFYHEAILTHPDKSTEKTSCLTLRGSSSLCLIDYKENGATIAVSLRWLDNDSYWLELMGRATPPKAEEKPAPNIKIEPEPASGNKATACSSCGTSLEPGTKFCTSCGTKVIDKPFTLSCPGCRGMIIEGVKFCTNCGQKI